MSQAATISRVKPSGICTHIWSTSHDQGRNCEDMLRHAIVEGQVTEAGVYIVCFTNANHMPFGRIYTVRRAGESFDFEGGIAAERVTRWPPRRT